MEALSLNKSLINKEIEFIDKDDYNSDEEYYVAIQDKIYDSDYRWLGMYDNDFHDQILQFAKIKFGKEKQLLVETDTSDCPDTSSELDYKFDDSDYGENFGLKFNSSSRKWSTYQFDFFDGSFGKPIHFEKLGIGKDFPSVGIDVEGEDFKAESSILYVGEGDIPVMVINGKNIISHVEVVVHGNSSKWELDSPGISLDDEGLPDEIFGRSPKSCNEE